MISLYSREACVQRHMAYLPTTHQWPGKGDGECFHFKSSECVSWINELRFNNWRILSTNGYNLCPSPVGFVNLSFISLYDEHLWRSDEMFCLWRLFSSLTKGYAECPIGVQSVLLICQRYEYRRWVVMNDNCRMCCSIGYRQLAIP